MSSEEIADLSDSQETTRKDPPLQCKGPCHDSFIIQKRGVSINLILPIDTPPVWLSEAGVGTGAGAPDVESELSASSDEVDFEAVVGAGTSANLEASSDHETPKETDAPSSCVVDPEVMLVSVRSSSDWEAVTMPDATFLGVALGACAAREGVEVPGGTYSGSRSSSEPMTMRVDGATDLDRPRA